MSRMGGRPRSAASGEENNSLYIQALANGLTILSVFDIEHPEWSLGDIARHTGISKTTAYRMLRTLEWTGFVAYSASSERYSIGPAVIPLSYLTLSHVGFSYLTHPVLERLAAATGETVELAVEGKGEAIVVGRVMRSLANSCMKVFAAHLPEKERERLIQAPQPPLTPHTITDPALLRAELARVAENGLAFDMEEQDLGVCAVSAPVFGPYQELKAVVTIVAPAERFRSDNGRRNVEAIRTASVELSGQLGQRTAAPQPTGS